MVMSSSRFPKVSCARYRIQPQDGSLHFDLCSRESPCRFFFLQTKVMRTPFERCEEHEGSNKSFKGNVFSKESTLKLFQIKRCAIQSCEG